MSTGKNRRYDRWRALNDELETLSFRHKGFPMSHRDSRTWAACLTLLSILIDDLGLAHHCTSSIESWAREIASFDAFDVAKALKDFDSLVLNSSRNQEQSKRLWDAVEIKPQQLSKLGVMDRITEPVRPIVQRWVEAGDVLDFTILHQYATFLGRVSLEDICEDGLTSDFITVDESLPPGDVKLCHQLNGIIVEWLRGFKITYPPHFSTGATADSGKLMGGVDDTPLKHGSSSLLSKYLHLGADQMLRSVIRRHANEWSEFLTPPIVSARLAKPVKRQSYLQFVPKSSTTKRVIAEEPATLNFWQKAIQCSLYDFIDSSPSLSSHIDLRDQGKSHPLVIEGSLHGGLATIDLSAASDRVAWDVVKRVFHGSPLLPLLWATRCREVWTSMGLVTLKKFATMGSAVTFPVETLLFAAVCENARRILCRRYGSGGCWDWRVYGDDIICSYDMVPCVLDDLRKLGFVVNNDKTFTEAGGCCFRESCGLEAFGGINVTPLRLSRRFSAGKDPCRYPDIIGSFVECANVALQRGYEGVRQYVIRTYLLHLPDSLRPGFSDSLEDPSCIHTLERLSINTKVAHPPHQRTSPNYMRSECWVGTVMRKKCWKRSPGFLESVRYFHYWIMKMCNPISTNEDYAYIGLLGNPTLESVRKPTLAYKPTSYSVKVNGFAGPIDNYTGRMAILLGKKGQGRHVRR